MVAFEITAVLTALPTITDQLHGDSLYGVALACYTLANLVALVVTGELTDRFGPARPYLASLAVFATGLVVAATAQSMELVVIGRTLQGAGTGGLAPIAYVLVKRAFPEDRQPTHVRVPGGWMGVAQPDRAGGCRHHHGSTRLEVGVLAAAAADPSGRDHHRSTNARRMRRAAAVPFGIRESVQPFSPQPGSAPS